MRPLSMFARKSEPSAEALAGSGPTTTYPAPPSSAATPEAIASVAGGTSAPKDKQLMPNPMGSPARLQTDPIAGLDISPGYAVPASANMAAAQANGFDSGSTPASYASTGPAGAAASGYQFGKKTFTPKTTETGPSPSGIAQTQPLAAQSAPAMVTPATTDYTAATTFAPPPRNTPPSFEVANAPSEQSNLGFSGFSLPESMNSEIAAQSPVAATEPEARTAAALGVPSTAPNYSPPAKASSTTTSSGGYAPGSTRSTSGYPGANDSTGSIYR